MFFNDLLCDDRVPQRATVPNFIESSYGEIGFFFPGCKSSVEITLFRVLCLPKCTFAVKHSTNEAFRLQYSTCVFFFLE